MEIIPAIANAPIRACGYVIFYEENISELKEKLQKLKGVIHLVEERVEDERRKEREITPVVSDWIRKVEHLMQEAERLFENLATTKHNCLNRYRFSRLAKNMTARIMSLMEIMDFATVSTPTPPMNHGLIMSSTSKDKMMKSFESRNKIIHDVIESIKDERIRMIGIVGVGGIGKTYLVKQVILIVQEQKLFDVIALASVTQSPDFWKIQGEMADYLGFHLEGMTLEERALRLRRILQSISKRILIVLDDIWTYLDFESIGFPSSGDHNCCKFIFTSRVEQVCHMMRSQKVFLLGGLSMEESWVLFQDTIGDDIVNNPVIRPIAMEIVKQCEGLPLAISSIALLLKRAKAKDRWEVTLDHLKNSKPSSEEVKNWIMQRYRFPDGENAERLLFLCCLFPKDADIPVEVVFREGWGLGWFQDQEALCNARRKAHILMNDMKASNILLDGDKKWCVKMQDNVREEITSTASNSFKIQLNAQEWWQEESTRNSSCAVTIMFDGVKECPSSAELEYPKLELLRATSEAGKSIPTNFFCGMKKLKVLCLQNACLPKISSLLPYPTNLRTLRLEHCQVGDVSVIGKVLLTLEILSFAFSDITELPTEIGQLRLLRLLDFTGCDKLYKVSSNVLARLFRLEELYFRVKNFPWMLNNDFLMELEIISRRLKVVEITVRKVQSFGQDLIFHDVDRFWLSIIPYAKYDYQEYLESNLLHIRAVDYNSFMYSMTIKHLLKKCEILMIEKVKNMRNCTSNLEDAKLSLKVLKVSKCSNLEYLVGDDQVQKSTSIFSQLAKLELEALPSLISFTKDNALNQLHPSIPHFPELETILIQNCKLLTTVFDLQSFKKLRVLTISHCESLTHVFVPAIAGAIPHLEELRITSCNQITSLVMNHEAKDSGGNGKLETMVFKSLYYLSLSGLQKLESICANSVEEEWPSLRQVYIDQCPRLKKPSFQPPMTQMLEMQDDAGMPPASNIHNIGFDNFKENKPHGCAALLSKFGHWARYKAPTSQQDQEFSLFKMNSLPNFEGIHIRECNLLNILFLLEENNDDLMTHSYLKSMKLEYCDKLESIVTKREETTMMNYFSQLQSLDLKNLPNLVRFCSFGSTTTSLDKHQDMGASVGDQRPIRNPLIHGFLFPELRSLYIKGCNKIYTLFSLSSFTSLTCLEELNLQDCENIQEVVSQEKAEESVEKFVFPELQHLLLEGLPNFKAFSQRPNIEFDFPSLLKVGIKACPNIEMFSRGLSNTPKLEHFEMKIEQHASNYVHMGDLNATVKGFKAFVELQGQHLLSWNDPDNEGIIYFQNSEMDINMFNKLLIFVPFYEAYTLQNVTKFNITECGSLIEVFKSIGGVDVKKGYPPIPYKLQSMKLEKLPNLRHIWGPNITRLVSFDNLRSVIVISCHSLKSLMSRSTAINLVHLEELIIEDCKIMEEVITWENKESRDRGNVVNILFPKLRRLTLHHLPKLNCFSSGGYDHNAVPLSDMDGKEIVEIQVIACEKLSSLAPLVHVHILQKVRKLKIGKSNSIVEAFEQGRGNGESTHYELESMELKELPQLKHIWGPNPSNVSCAKLTSIEIAHCDNLKSVFSHSMASTLVQLKELRVGFCNRMEVLVKMDEEIDVATLFLNLEKLEICNLPKLESVCSRDHGYDVNKIVNEKQKQMSLQKLEHVTLQHVPSLKCFYLGAYDYDLMLSLSGSEENTWITRFPRGNVTVRTPNLHQVHTSKGRILTFGDLNLTISCIYNATEQHQIELQTLKTFRCIGEHQYQQLSAYIMRETCLELECCHKLVNCIPSNTAHLFQHLEELHVRQCRFLEEIFESNDYEFTKLHTLELHALPKLKHIWGNHSSLILGFQNLERLSISECHDLQFVFPDVSVAKNLPRLRSLVVRQCKNMEEIIQKNSSPPTGANIIFQALWHIELEKLPMLTCFCSSRYYFELPSCEYITINECPNMKTFCYGALYTPSLSFFSVEGRKIDEDEEVNKVIEEKGRSFQQ